MRFALRSLLRRPGYASTAILVLACAVGASTAVFTLVDAVLIRPLPFADQGRLAVLWAGLPEHPLVEISYPDFLDFRSETRAFQDVAAHGSTPWNLKLTGVGDAVDLPFGAVSGSFFDVLGARAELGRTLSLDDEAPGAARVAVLSNQLWQQRFAGDPSVIGRVISLDREPYTIVGVMPSRFDYPAGSQLWAPLKLTIDGLPDAARDNLRRIGFLYLVGRLGPGVTLGQATDDATAVLRRLSERHSFGMAERRAVVTPLVTHLLGPTRPALMLLAVAVGLVLLLAYINVAGLALVRAASRRPEISVRYALGASRGDVFAMLFAEAALLCACALALAVPAAFLSLRFFVALAPSVAGGIEEATIGLRAVIFACGAALVAALFATVQPVFASASRVNSFDTRQFGRSARTGLGRQAIIAVEVGVTVVVLTAAGLAVRSFWNLRGLDLGYDTGRILLVQASGGDYARLGDALRNLPGVRAAGAVSLKPLSLGPIGDDAAFQLDGQTREQVLRNPALNHLGVTPGYFEAMGIRLLAGRLFEDRDLDARPPIAIVSDTTARAIWGNTNVVGRKIRVARLDPNTPSSTVVGVVESVRHREVHETRLDFYVPSRTASTWAIGTTGNPAGVAGAVRTLLRQMDPASSIEITTLQSLVDDAQRPWEFTALVLATFAALALLLAATAVHGLVAYAVSLRTAEFGIRMALGATPRQIVSLVFRSTGAVALIGLLMGVPASLAAARAMRSMLFEVSAFDATTLMAAVSVLAIALAGACALPGRRAARVDPTVALRTI